MAIFIYKGYTLLYNTRTLSIEGVIMVMIIIIQYNRLYLGKLIMN